MTYAIDTVRNSYFNGRDAVLLKDGERVATLAMKDEGPGVKVKVSHWGSGDPEMVKLRTEIPDEALNEIAESIALDFWETLAPEIARTHGFHSVWQAGRSGGWCVPYPSDDWADIIAIDEGLTTVPVRPRDPNRTADDTIDAIAARARYFAFAEEITTLVESLRTDTFDGRLPEAHAERMDELESERKADKRRATISALDDVTLGVHAAHAIALAPREEQERIVFEHSIAIEPEEVKP